MAGSAWHDRDQARPDELCYSVDGHLELAFDHFVDFFLRMEILVNGCAAREVLVGECHVGGVEIAPEPVSTNGM